MALLAAAAAVWFDGIERPYCLCAGGSGGENPPDPIAIQFNCLSNGIVLEV